VKPLISVITGISLEHTAFLGPDLTSIAREKGGIIKPGRPVVIGPMADEALEEIRRLAHEQQARLVPADQTVSIKRLSRNLAGQKIKIESAANSYGPLTLPLAGLYQLENMAIAIATLDELATQAGMDLSARVVKAGLESLHWPGRFHVLAQDPVVIVDGAHNPEGADGLAEALQDLLPGRPIGLVLGICSDKDIDRFLLPFAGLVKRCWAVPLKNERSLPPAEVAAKAGRLGWLVTESTVQRAIEEATDWAQKNQGAICVTGSLFLAGEALELKLGSDLFANPSPGPK
ncbi:MAG: bifunctional folylpolyglutamate synthase/dihydrofolate synthase, partial [Verrucomicrobia bacterium]|nr:bifunctional folylpolyglutamate synthase/dihydrofolate synthase [Verrucomicrobiota bacterium]